MAHQIVIHGPFRATKMDGFYVELFHAVCAAGDLATFVSTREAVEEAGRKHLVAHQDDDPREEVASVLNTVLAELPLEDLQLLLQLAHRMTQPAEIPTAS